MNLYVVQHAEAKLKEEDEQRPLTEYGFVYMRKVAAYIVAHTDARVTTIYHSSKKRSQQTAEIIAESLEPSSGIKLGKELEPTSAPWGWVEKLAQMDEDIMIVGHLPHLQRLSSLLLWKDESKKIIEFHNGGIINLTKDESGLWAIKWIIIPQIILQS